MWRVITSTIAALTLFSSIAAAQAPCTTDANRVVAVVHALSLDAGKNPGNSSLEERNFFSRRCPGFLINH